VNGSEAFNRPQQIDPRLMYGTPGELNDAEKMDLMAGDGTPYARAIDKLMKLEIVKARNAAMESDPADRNKQATLMTVAHAMNAFYENIRGQVLLEKTSHLADVKLRAAQEEMQDQQKVEEIILSQR